MPDLKPSGTPLPTLATIPPCLETASAASVPTATLNPEESHSLFPDPAGSGPLRIVGQIGGPTRAVAVADNYVLVGVGSRLTVLDTSDKETICERGSTQALGASVRAIAISGKVAYVTAGEAGLYVVDTSDPAQPVVVGNYNSPGYAEGVSVIGQVAYLADGPYGLRIVDVTDGAQPVEISAVYELNYAFDVAVDAGYAYLAAAGAGLLVAGISDAAHPTEAGSYDTPGYAYGVTSSGATLFVADGWEGVQVLDVSNPDQPESIASYDTAGWAMDVAAHGEMLFVAGADGGLRVLDISDRLMLMEVGSYQTAYGHAAQVAVRGETVYVADIHLGVHIVDVSAPAQPRLVSLYSPMGYAQAVAVAGQYAYVSAGNFGFRVIDLADPSRPQEVAAALQGITSVSVALSGTTAYVGSIIGGSSNRPGALYPIDISDSLHPKASPEIGFQDPPRSVFIQGTTAYYAVEWGLSLLDLSDPLAPRQLGFLQTITSFAAAEAVGVAVVENTAYVAVSAAGLYTIDVSNPRQPVLVGVFDERATDGIGKFGDVVVALPFAYILDTDRVRVLDVSDPKQPKSLGSFRLPGTPSSSFVATRYLAIDGHRLFVAAGAAGLLELDVSDPAEPRLAAELRLPGNASWVTVDDRYVYVADGEGGLFIVDPGRVSSSNSSVRTAWQIPPISANSNPSPAVIYSPVEAPTAAWQAGTELSGQASLDYQLAAYRYQGNTIIVTNAEDSGPGTLREALDRAASGDTISFDEGVFPPDAPVAIRLLSQLPPLSQGGLTLDASNAGVILDASDTPPGTSGLTIQSSDNVVMGLQILNFPKYGITIGGHGNTVGGNRSRGAGLLGEGNLISGNKEVGIHVCCGEDASENRIVGNYIGTDLTGMGPFGNRWFGIVLSGNRNVIGGLTPGDRNIISGNGMVDIAMGQASGNLIAGNTIGLDAAGHNRLSPPGSGGLELAVATSSTRIERNVIAWGILIDDSGSSYNEIVGNYIGTDVSGTVSLGDGAQVSISAPFNRIGGTRPGEGNVINGSIRIIGDSDVVVVGNLIGVDATGEQAFAATGASVRLEDGADHNFVGGLTEAERNVIAGGWNEMQISISGGSDFNFIIGNYLGTDASGTLVFPNGVNIGLWLDFAEHNAIQGNLIAGSQEVGVGLAIDWHRPVANFNVLRANQITQNPKLGIAVGGGMGNTIVANTVTENGFNAQDGGRDNYWDDGNEGNYWGDYQGQDSNGDGIGDTPYTVPPNGVDNYPRMIPSQGNDSPH